MLETFTKDKIGEKMKFKDFAIINPKETLVKNEPAKYIPMASIEPFTRKISCVETKKFKGGTKFRNGDTLIARITPCLENGKTAFVDILENNEVAFGSTEYIVVRECSGVSDAKYLYYLARSPLFRSIAIKSMTGTSGRQRVQIGQIENKFFLLPPLSEQKRIASILSSFDDKIELLQEQNRTLEETAKAIFKEWFVNFNFPGATEEMITSELGKIPIGWEAKKLIDVLLIRNGFAFKSKDYVTSGIPIVRTKNFNGKSIELDDVVYLTKDKSKEYENFKLSKFDFLLVMVGASIGNSVITPSYILPALQNQNMWNFKPLNGNFKFYYNLLLEQLVSEQANSASGSAREFFRKDHFYSLPVVVPNNEIIEKFNKLVFGLFEKLDLNFSTIKTLSEFRDNLLPRLMKDEG